jgi:hypothetical protein
VLRELAWVLGPLAVAGVLAGLLAAPQLLPTQEVTGQGIRAGGMTYREVVAFSLPPWMLPLSLLPVYTAADQPGSEWQGALGVVGLVLAAVGVAAGQPRRRVWLLAAIAVGAFLLALGQFGPLYPVLYRIVPGLGLFRVPARWLFVYAFAAAMLSGFGVQALVCARPPPRRVALALGAIVLPLGAFAAVIPGYPIRLPGAAVMLAWAGLTVAALALVWLGRRTAAPALVALLAIELVVASWPFDVNRVGPPEAYRSLRPTESHLLTELADRPGLYRTLAITDSGFDPGDLALLRGQVEGLLSPERVEDWVAVV